MISGFSIKQIGPPRSVNKAHRAPPEVSIKHIGPPGSPQHLSTFRLPPLHQIVCYACLVPLLIWYSIRVHCDCPLVDWTLDGSGANKK